MSRYPAQTRGHENPGLGIQREARPRAQCGADGQTPRGLVGGVTEVRDMLFVCRVLQIKEIRQRETGSGIVSMVGNRLLEPGGK